MRAARLSLRDLMTDGRDLWFARRSGRKGLSELVLVFTSRPTRFESNGRAEWAATQGSLAGRAKLATVRRLLGTGAPENDRECVVLNGSLN